jgi:putative MATE family efflux protein
VSFLVPPPVAMLRQYSNSELQLRVLWTLFLPQAVSSPAMSGPGAPSRINLTHWGNPAELARIVLLLSMPVAITNALQALLGWVDTRMVSHYVGEAALPALGVGRTGMFFVSSFFMGLGVGITAYVARLIGAHEPEKARVYSTVGVLVGGLGGLVIMLIGLLLGEGPVHFMVASKGGDVDPAMALATSEYAWAFMRVMFISLGAVGMQFAAVSVFNSLGRTMVPMWFLVVNNVVNLLGNLYYVPRYGVAGSAWSTCISTFVVTVVAIAWLSRDKAMYSDFTLLFRLEPLRELWRKALEMVRVGLPVAAQVVLRSGSMLVLMKLITYLPNSVAGQSAMQVGIQAESLAFMPAFAFSTAAATLVGQNLGAHRADQARQAVWFCLVGSQIIMWTMGLLQFIWPEWFVRLYIGDSAPEVIAPAAQYLRVLAICLPGLGLGLTMMGALRGSGDTRVTMYITLSAMYLVRLPLAFLLSQKNLWGSGIGLDWGLDGLWWAMTASVYVEAFLAWLRFRGGEWARVKLEGRRGSRAERDGAGGAACGDPARA